MLRSITMTIRSRSKFGGFAGIITYICTAPLTEAQPVVEYLSVYRSQWNHNRSL